MNLLYPTFQIICGIDILMKELDTILQTDSELPQLQSYDTFQLGHWSPLLYRTHFSAHHYS